MQRDPNGRSRWTVSSPFSCDNGPWLQNRVGANAITLVQGRATGFFDHVMYDYVNLELP